MRENKHIKILKKTTWYITLFSIVFIIFLHELNSTISYNDWQGILGGYVGSLVGGIATLIAVIFTLEHTETENAKKDLFEKKNRMPVLVIDKNRDEISSTIRHDNEDKGYKLFIRNVTDNIAVINELKIIVYDFIGTNNEELSDFITYKLSEKYAFMNIKQVETVGIISEERLTTVVSARDEILIKSNEVTNLSDFSNHKRNRWMMGEISIVYSNMMDEHYVQYYKVAINLNYNLYKISMVGVPKEVFIGKKGFGYSFTREWDKYEYNKK